MNNKENDALEAYGEERQRDSWLKSGWHCLVVVRLLCTECRRRRTEFMAHILFFGK